jgi:hypothetical protein
VAAEAELSDGSFVTPATFPRDARGENFAAAAIGAKDPGGALNIAKTLWRASLPA